MGNTETDVIALKKILVERRLERTPALSRASGVGRTTLSNILNGRIQPSSEVIRKLIVALSLSPATAGEIFFSDNLHNVQG